MACFRHSIFQFEFLQDNGTAYEDYPNKKYLFYCCGSPNDSITLI
jgi:hypothetical protein